MKKISLLLAAWLCLQAPKAVAQMNVVAESETFQEYESGHLKIVILKNKETALLHFNNHRSIDWKMYDAAHKLKFEKSIKPATPYKMKGGEVLGVFETTEGITAIYSSYNHRVPTLNRLVLDPATGEVKQDQVIAKLKRMRFFDGYAMAFGGVPLPEFFLNLDEETGCYAVAQYNTFESDRNRRIQVVHYNNSNKEIARAYYQSPKNKYKYMEFLDLATIGSKEVVVSVLGRNTVASGGDKAGILLMGSLKAGAKAFDMQKVNYNAGRPSKIKAALTRYNPHTGDIYLLTLESAGQKKSMMQFRSQLSIIDADWHINSRMVTTKKIQDLTKKHYKKENTFLAVPQNLYVNKDGGFSVLFEEQKIVTTNTSTGSGSGFSTKTRTTCTMGDIGVQRYDREGNEQSVYYIPKSHYYGTLIPDYMYNAKVQQCGVRLHWGYQFKSFAYVPVGERGYVLFNDIERNAKKVEKKREVSTVSAAGDLEAFVFDLNEQNAVPVRKQIFAAEGKNDRSLGLFNGSNYNAAHKLMTVVVTQPRTKDARNNTKVVWLSVD
ncbi:hypothetical protein D3C71_194050 [compost metagenome]